MTKVLLLTIALFSLTACEQGGSDAAEDLLDERYREISQTDSLGFSMVTPINEVHNGEDCCPLTGIFRYTIDAHGEGYIYVTIPGIGTRLKCNEDIVDKYCSHSEDI